MKDESFSKKQVNLLNDTQREMTKENTEENEKTPEQLLEGNIMRKWSLPKPSTIPSTGALDSL